MKKEQHLAISIVIVSKNRHESLLTTTDALLQQVASRHDTEILLIEETDTFRPIEKELVRHIPIPKRGFGFGYARNVGLREARGSLLIFVDDDVLPSKEWLSAIMNPFADPHVGAVGGAILPNVHQINEIGKAISLLGFPAGGLARYLGSGTEIVATNLISTGNCAFRADMARRIGGFDESLKWGGEDQDFFARMSEISKTFFTPNATVYHRQRDSYRELFHWFIRRGKADFCRKCKHQNSLKALFFPLRGNFLLKLTVFFLFLSSAMYFSPITAISFGLASLLAWGYFLWHRASRNLNSTSNVRFHSEALNIRASLLSGQARWLLFSVKLIMDLAHELGKFIAFRHYLSNRLFSKPLVLTFHDLGDCAPKRPYPNRRYYCSIEGLRSFVHECQQAGRRIAPLSEIIRRLRESPRSLYFDKILSITFDDAYLSLYKCLVPLLRGEHIPVTLFVPTAFIGKTNQWDEDKGFAKKEILDWPHLKALKGLGVELCSHSRHHFRLTECPSDLKRDEIFGSLADLERFFTTSPGFVFSYPYGAYDPETKEIVKEAGYIGATVNFAGNIRPTTDPYEIPRFTVLSEVDWKHISTQSRSMWIKDFLKDIRNSLFSRVRPFKN